MDDSRRPPAAAADAPSIELDAVDHRLLDLLQADASRTNHALAEAAQVSPATALRRVRRLIDAGVIERQVALVAPRLAEAGLTAISEISLDRQGAEHLDAFEARALADGAIQQCYRVSPRRRARSPARARRLGAGHAGVERGRAAPVHAGRERAQREDLLQRAPCEVPDADRVAAAERPSGCVMSG